MNRNTGEHVYYEFTNPNTKKTIQDYMNKWEWDAIQRNRTRRVHFTLLKEINVNTGASAETSEKQVEAPEIVEDKLECPLCGYVSIDENDLQAHKKEKHT